MEFYQHIMMCLGKAHKIGEYYRNQKFGFADKEFKDYIPDLSQLLGEIQKRNLKNQQEELVGIFNELLRIKESSDYVSLADIMEKEIKHFLEELLQYVRETEEIYLPEFWEKNMVILRRKNPDLAKRLEEPIDSDTYYHLIPADNGYLTLAVEENNQIQYFHSRLDPEEEGKRFAVAYEGLEADTYIIYGFGLGYHVEGMASHFPYKKLVVLESDLELLQIAFRYRDCSDLLDKPNVSIQLGEEKELLSKYLNQRKEQQGFILYRPSLKRVKDQKVKEILEDYFLRTNSMLMYSSLLKDNFERNFSKKYPPIDEIQGKFQGKTMILVSAGPSLDDDIQKLKNLPQDILVVAVGTVAKRLQKEQIPMDYIVLSDPTDMITEQIEGFDGTNIPLLLLSTAYHLAGEEYSGKVFLIYQKGFLQAEEEAKKKGLMTFETGGSVSTLALDLGLRFGVSKIICVGLDLAYTNFQHHAGTEKMELQNEAAYRKVEGIGEKWVYTIKNLDTYRKWIEKRILSENYIAIVNTAKGARIHGMIEMSLEQALSD